MRNKLTFCSGLTVIVLATACSSTDGAKDPRVASTSSAFTEKEAPKPVRVTNWEKILDTMMHKKGAGEKFIAYVICRKNRHKEVAAVCGGMHRFVKTSVCGRIGAGKDAPKIDDIDFVKKWDKFIGGKLADGILLPHEAKALTEAPKELLFDLLSLCDQEDSVWEKSAKGCVEACKKLTADKSTSLDTPVVPTTATVSAPVGGDAPTTALAAPDAVAHTCVAGDGLFSQFSCEPKITPPETISPSDGAYPENQDLLEGIALLFRDAEVEDALGEWIYTSPSPVPETPSAPVVDSPIYAPAAATDHAL